MSRVRGKTAVECNGQRSSGSPSPPPPAHWITMMDSCGEISAKPGVPGHWQYVRQREDVIAPGTAESRNRIIYHAQLVVARSPGEPGDYFHHSRRARQSRPSRQNAPPGWYLSAIAFTGMGHRTSGEKKRLLRQYRRRVDIAGVSRIKQHEPLSRRLSVNVARAVLPVDQAQENIRARSSAARWYGLTICGVSRKRFIGTASPSARSPGVVAVDAASKGTSSRWRCRAGVEHRINVGTVALVAGRA